MLAPRSDDEGAALIAALEALEADVALAKDLPEDVIALGRRAPPSCADDLRFLLRADDPEFVYLPRSARPRHRSCAPRRSTSRRSIRELLLDRMHATVLTSATLTVDGSFDYVRGRLGIADARAS